MPRVVHPFRLSQLLNFFFLGLLLFVLAGVVTIFIDDSSDGLAKWILFCRDIIFHTGITLVAVAIIDRIWRATGGEPMGEELADLRKSVSKLPLFADSLSTGLRRIKARCVALTSEGFDWVGFLSDAQRQVDISGYTLRQWYTTNGFRDALKVRVFEGVVVRVLFMDEANGFLRSLVYDHACQNETDVKSAILMGKEFFASLAKDINALGARGRLEARTLKRESIVTCSIARSDDRVLATHYLYSELAAASPVIECERGGDFLQVYEKEFETLWALADPIVASGSSSTNPAAAVSP